MQKRLETAGDEPQKESAYEGDRFLGKIGEVYYTICFEEDAEILSYSSYNNDAVN